MPGSSKSSLSHVEQQKEIMIDQKINRLVRVAFPHNYRYLYSYPAVTLDKEACFLSDTYVAVSLSDV